MKKIHDFGSWLSEGKKSLTKRQMAFLDRYTQGTWSYNEASGEVDIKGSFNCSGKGLATLSDIRFGRVSGHFDCHTNSLTRLGGAPREVGGSFTCHNNDLSSLEGAPETVGGDFYCTGNLITSLEGAPRVVGGEFKCSHNKTLTSLVGAPAEVGGDFVCIRTAITSLEGSPQVVGGDFYCNSTDITSLVGAPRVVGGSFKAYHTPVKSLVGAPQKIGGVIEVGNFLRDLPIEMDGKDWNLQGWIRAYKEGSEETRALIATLPDFKETAEEHPDEFEDMSGLADLGF